MSLLEGSRISEILELVKKAKEQFESEDSLIEISNVKKAVFVGDTHGADFITRAVLEVHKDADVIVFIGDFVDRGPNGIENLELLLKEHLENPKRVILLRGNHESPLTNYYYGFVNEVKRKMGQEEYYEEFKNMFAVMPYAALFDGGPDDKYLVVHGGIARDLKKVEEIKTLPRPDVNPDNAIAFELLWNDPREELDGFVPNIRGDGTFFYGKDVTKKFLEENGLKGIIRGHEVADGWRVDVIDDQRDMKVITVFSSAYHGMRAGALVWDGEKKSFIYDYVSYDRITP
ncbi:MAG: metallophosphoesterase [Candidatus Aramenus sulfurataquae]|jgi:protein phosphatase|uniref:Metallophosphoesterase n=2 Tax=Candidatus Aramenus sulfurataquae TaxID=1326980 RepID=W7KW01_9CREN|nr:MAG: metallophosphoesterase [Candidatus Aramenus sulfurataquae]MCL7344432.1 serine/threonine protein phosphatase [Candidatus Aramenus sulfurataquae]